MEGVVPVDVVGGWLIGDGVVCEGELVVGEDVPVGSELDEGLVGPLVCVLSLVEVPVVACL